MVKVIAHNDIHISINPFYLNVAIMFLSECLQNCFILENLISVINHLTVVSSDMHKSECLRKIIHKKSTIQIKINTLKRRELKVLIIYKDDFKL